MHRLMNSGVALAGLAAAVAEEAMRQEAALAHARAKLSAAFGVVEPQLSELVGRVKDMAAHMSMSGPRFDKAVDRVVDAVTQAGRDLDLSALQSRLERLLAQKTDSTIHHAVDAFGGMRIADVFPAERIRQITNTKGEPRKARPANKYATRPPGKR